MNWSQFFGGVVSSLFGLTAGYWIAVLRDARVARHGFCVMIECLLEEFKAVKNENIEDWYKGSIKKITDESIRVTRHVHFWKRRKFFWAWRRYCNMSREQTAPDHHCMIEDLHKGTFLKVDYSPSKLRIYKQLKAIVDAAN